MAFYPILLDLIMILLGIMIVVSSYRKGFLRSVVLLAGYIASVFIAAWIGGWLSGWIYDTFIRDAVISSIDKTAAMAAEGMPFATVLTEVFDKLPSFIVNPLLAGFGGEDKLIADLEASTGGVLEQLGTTIADTVVAPIVTLVLQMFCCLLIFILCVIIVKMVASLLKGFYAIPILGPVNAVLGGVVGLLKAGIILYVLAIAGAMIISLSGNQLSWFNSDIVQDSHIFKWFYNFANQ